MIGLATSIHIVTYFSYGVCIIIVKLLGEILDFHQLWISMKHHEWIGNNAPLRSKTRFSFKLGLGWKPAVPRFI